MALKPPTKLSKQQFLARRPGGVYQNYLNAYKRQHPALDKPRPVTYGGLLAGLQQSFETPAQIEARANRMARQQTATSAADIRAEAKLMRDEAQNRALSMAAAGRAAAAQNAGLFGMVGGEYNAAAREIANLGTNLSNQAVATTEGDVLAQNAGLAAVGAPPVAVGGPAGSNTIAGPTQGAVSAYQFGKLPAEAITTAGEASQFGLAGMVSAQNLRATQEAQAAFQGAVREADTARTAALKELQRGRPGLAAQFLMQLQDAQRQQISLAMTLLNSQTGMRQGEAELGLSRQELAAQQAAQRRAEAQAQREYAESVRQFNVQQTEEVRQFNKTLAAQKAEARRSAGGGTTGAQAQAEFFANLANNADANYINQVPASVYYKAGNGVPSKPPKGKDHTARVNAVANYYLRSYWPAIEQNVPQKLRPQRKAEFVQRIKAWFLSSPLPTLEEWKFANLKGG